MPQHQKHSREAKLFGGQLQRHGHGAFALKEVAKSPGPISDEIKKCTSRNCTRTPKARLQHATKQLEKNRRRIGKP